MNIFKIIVCSLFFTALFLTCYKQREPIGPIAYPDEQEYEIPDFIIASADSFIISKTGQTFFLSYIKLDSSRSQLIPPDTVCLTHPSQCTSLLPYAHLQYGLHIQNSGETLD